MSWMLQDGATCCDSSPGASVLQTVHLNTDHGGNHNLYHKPVLGVAVSWMLQDGATCCDSSPGASVLQTVHLNTDHGGNHNLYHKPVLGVAVSWMLQDGATCCDSSPGASVLQTVHLNTDHGGNHNLTLNISSTLLCAKIYITYYCVKILLGKKSCDLSIRTSL